MDPLLLGMIGAQTAGQIGGLFAQSSIESQNLAQQQNVFNYQKMLQERIFEREDTSIQRRVEDLRSAGLSPVLAAGQGARAGAPIQVKAPQRGSSDVQQMLQMAPQLVGLAQMRKDISKTNAEIDLIKQQADRVDVEKKAIEANTNRTLLTTDYERSLFPRKIALLSNELSYKGQTLMDRIKATNLAVQQGQLNIEKLTQSNKALAYANALSEITVEWQKELRDYIKKTEGNVNPAVLNYYAGQIAYMLKQHDFEFWQTMQLPSTGGLDTITRLGGAGTNILGELLKNKR